MRFIGSQARCHTNVGDNRSIILGILTSIYILGWFIEDDFENDSKFKDMVIKCAAYISIPIFC